MFIDPFESKFEVKIWLNADLTLKKELQSDTIIKKV